MPVPTERQVSAGGVAFRRSPAGIELALVRVGKKQRWQLPKGHVDEGESPEEAALRETREEAGIETELIAPLETIEYWFFGGTTAGRMRYHKFVHFYLLEYRFGDVQDHDHEVDEARWVPVDEAVEMLAFASERKVARQAVDLLDGSK
jgi:8-oxo-dGTP diphosphatase